MKHNAFIEALLLLLGIWCGFQGILFLAYLLNTLIAGLFGTGNYYASLKQFVYQDLVFVLIYGGLAFYLLKRSQKKIDVGDEETNMTHTPRNEFIFKALVIISILFIIIAIPDFFDMLLQNFREKLGSTRKFEPVNTELTVPFLRLVLPLILLIMSKKIAERLNWQKKENY